MSLHERTTVTLEVTHLDKGTQAFTIVSYCLNVLKLILWKVRGTTGDVVTLKLKVFKISYSSALKSGSIPRVRVRVRGIRYHTLQP